MRIALAALAAVLIALAGCGEKDEPETTGPVVPVSTSTTDATTTTSPSTTTTTTSPADVDTTTASGVVEAFLTSTDGALVCDELITPRFLKASYGDRAGCIAARDPAALAQSVQTQERREGADTVVVAMPSGGVSDGERLTFTVVAAGGSFQIDSLASNAPVGP